MALFKKLKESIQNRSYKVQINRLPTTNDDEYNRGVKKVLNLLNYTKVGSVSYSAGDFASGYHSIKIDDHEISGQRNPLIRFKDLPFSLTGLSVLDIGCNQGGMLYAFANEIKYGIGIDYDSRMINAANKIKSYSKVDNLNYYVFNLESENLEYINDFLPEDKVDVVFLLSVCMWIKNWKEVIDFSVNISDKLIFESNGKAEQQEEQINYLKRIYSKVELIHERSEDDPSQKMRQLLYCS
jgi:SAM-dependent methyltransferase